MKILYVTTIGSTMDFFKSFIQELVNDGHTVDIACNEMLAPVADFYAELDCKQFHIDCSRSPLDSSNIKCIKQIKKMVEDNQYDMVHCHTPIAAACTRLACKGLRKKRRNTEYPLRVFYTAHGFHFYKGAPNKNWIIYYPIEWLCAHWTDTLITINKEDFALAQRRFSCGGKCRIEYVPGVGINVDKFADAIVDKKQKCEEFGIPEDAFLLLSVGELNQNKNHRVVLKAMKQLKDMGQLGGHKIHYMIAGSGKERGRLIELVNRYQIEKEVHFLGQRSDCAQLYKMANVNIFPSIREGLGLAALEGMVSGLPLICSDNRGTRDFAVNNENAIICDAGSVEDFSNAILRCISDHDFVNNCKTVGPETAKHFSEAISLQKQELIYKQCMKKAI